MIPVMIGIIVVIFTMLYFAPGDGARSVLGTDATEEMVRAYRDELGLNDPYFVQLGRYMYNVVFRLDLGISYRSRVPVIQDIMERLPNTALLAALACFFGGILGVVAGIVSAVKQYSFWDRACSAIALFGIATPTFWLALMLVIVFSVNLRWLPASGNYGWKYWIMPVISLSLWEAGMTLRMSRSAMLDVIRQDYMRTARAKGQKKFVVLTKHGLRNALIPIITVIGLEFCQLLAGAIVTETVFAIPGIGKYCYDAITMRDYPAVQGTVLFIAALCVVINLLMDLVYGLIDPRIKAMYQTKKTVSG
jgi:peptide/nickel transport system permease protein